MTESGRSPLSARVTPNNPAVSTPERHARSIRRTSTLDVTRLAGVRGPVTLVGRARDLVTTEGAAKQWQTTLRAEVDFFGGAVLQSIESEPCEPRLASLTGHSSAGGFRSALTKIVGADLDGQLLWALLDDMPTLSFLSSAALYNEGGPEYAHSLGLTPAADDICAGWMKGGWLGQQRDLGLPTDRAQVPMPELAHGEDRLSWHEFPALEPGGVRRRRRLDLVSQERDRSLTIDAMFRDTLMPRVGTELIMHEYSINGSVSENTDNSLPAGRAACVARSRVSPCCC